MDLHFKGYLPGQALDMHVKRSLSMFEAIALESPAS